VRYMLLIHDSEAEFARLSPEAVGQMMEEYMQFTTDLQEAGAFVASDRLRPVASATTVRVRDGEVLTTDGPFAETKEQFGGYYLIDVADLDAALRWAARVPSAKIGSIEVRPIWEMEEYETAG